MQGSNLCFLLHLSVAWDSYKMTQGVIAMQPETLSSVPTFTHTLHTQLKALEELERLLSG